MNLETRKKRKNPFLLKKMMFPFVRQLFIVFALTVSLASCTSSMGDMSSGLLELGQGISYGKCNKRYINYRDYQACIGRVDESYNEAYK